MTLNPGVYVIAGGGLSVSGHATLTGNGVLIYVAGSNYPGAGGSFGGVTLSGAAAVSLTPASTGTYAGITLFQARDNNRALSFGSSAQEGINGFVYAPKALLTLSGSVSTVRTGIIVDRLNTSGTASSGLTSTSSGTEDGTPAGELLSTSLFVYVNSSSIQLSSDQLARIYDAITSIDSLIEAYGVVSPWCRSCRRNVTISLASTTTLRGVSAGVLGVYDPTSSQVTLVDGWNWHARATAAASGHSSSTSRRSSPTNSATPWGQSPAHRLVRHV